MDEARAGKALFEIVAVCRQAQIEPESALRRYTRGIIEEVS